MAPDGGNDGRDDVAAEDASTDGTVESLLYEAIDAIESLGARVEQLEQQAAEPAAEIPFDRWMPWFIATYALENKIPERWETIPGVRQELEALWAGWLDAYKADCGPKVGSRAVAWHADLERALERLKGWRAQSVRHDHHTPLPHREAVADV